MDLDREIEISLRQLGVTEAIRRELAGELARWDRGMELPEAVVERLLAIISAELLRGA